MVSIKEWVFDDLCEEIFVLEYGKIRVELEWNIGGNEKSLR